MLISVLFGLFMAQQLYAAAATKTFNEILPLVQVDAYAPCLNVRGDAYCFVSARLYGDSSHPLYNALLKHSSNNLTHFDRKNIHRGVCLKTSCQEYLSSSNVTETIEGCLNATLKRQYGLTARVFRITCSEYSERVQFDAGDLGFGALVVLIIMLNLLGSLYDFSGGRGEDTIVARLLSCFAVRRSWWKLVAPPSSDPRQRRLLTLSGYRVIMSVGVILEHSCMCSHLAIANPETVEESYNNPINLIFYRGMEILQMFSILSAIFMVYNVLLVEKHVTWRNLHFVLLRRWLRFTPVYALMLFFHATWARYAAEGPFWKATMEVETDDCRRDWWLHLLYIHNYTDHSRCMIHSWSMALDMQLTAVALCIFFLLKSSRARKAAIALLLAVGLIAPPATVYFKNLHPVLIPSPEFIRTWFADDPTFNNLYKRTHTNFVIYGLGMVLGYIIYDMKDSDFGSERYKKYSILQWVLLPFAVALQLTGSVFHDPGQPVPLLVGMVFSSGIKLVTGSLLCLHVFLTIVEADGVLSSIYKWRGWTPLSRLTFCVYLLHVSMLRMRAAASHTTLYLSGYFMLQNFMETTIASFLLALPLFLLVEAPFNQLVKLCFARQGKKHAD